MYGWGILLLTDMQKLDVKAVISRFGGRSTLWRKLAAAGHKINVRALDQWVARENIPTVWIIRLLELAGNEGWNFSIKDFLSPTNNGLHQDQDHR